MTRSRRSMPSTEVRPVSEYEKALSFNRSIKEALTVVFDALNQGQQMKLMRDEKVKALFERYGVKDADS